MKKKVVEVVYGNRWYDDDGKITFDGKVLLECGHPTHLWMFKGNPMNTLQDCDLCRAQEVIHQNRKLKQAHLDIEGTI